MNDFTRRTRALWRLIDNKEEIIERWTRELGQRGSPINHLNLTARQRRVIAGLRWEREVAKLSDPRDGLTTRVQQPPPVVGLDANNRVVVQRVKDNGQLQVWALTREGEPFAIKLPVYSLKTGRLVSVPPHTDTIEER